MTHAHLLEAHGYGGGLVTFDGWFVEITKRGAAGLVDTGGSKRIPLRAISTVQLRPARWLSNGYIRFTTGGADPSVSLDGTSLRMAAGENSVIFTRRQQPAFEVLCRAVETAMAR